MFEPADQSRMRLASYLSLPITDLAAVTHSVHIPAGYTFDGASIPRLLWALIGAPFAPDLILAACVHDWYCDHARCYHERLIGDAVFFKLLHDAGVPYWRRAVLYAAVRAYAWWLWTVTARRYRGLARRRPKCSSGGLTSTSTDVEPRPPAGDEPGTPWGLP